MTDLTGLLIGAGCLILIEALALFAYWLWARYDDRRHARMIAALFDLEVARIQQEHTVFDMPDKAEMDRVRTFFNTKRTTTENEPALDQSGVSRACGGDS